MSTRFERFGVVSGLVLESGDRWADVATRVQVDDVRAVLRGDPPFAYITRSRGYSKTTDMAAVALELLLTMPPRSRLVWSAADADQAGLALDAVGGFVQRTPFLSGLVEVQSRRVVAVERGSTLIPLSADSASAWGLKPSAVFVDEFAQHPDVTNARRLWEALSSAVLKVKGARLVVMTTAGSPSHFSYAVLEHARSSPLWRVSETPGPPPWAPQDRLEEQRARLPEAVYRQLWLNEWTEAAGSFFDPDAVDRCFVLPGPALRPVDGRSYFAALDLGHVNDRSVLAVAHLEAGAVELDGLHVWRGSSARPVNFGEVEEAVVDVHRRFGCRVLLDPWQALHLAQRLRRHGVRVEEFNFSVGSRQRLASTLLQAVNDGALRLFEAEGLREELRALRVRQSSSGQWSFDHAAGRHDDMAVAVALACVGVLDGRPAQGWMTCRWCGRLSTECNGGSLCGGDGFREPVVQRGDRRLVGSRYVDADGWGETVTRI